MSNKYYNVSALIASKNYGKIKSILTEYLGNYRYHPQKAKRFYLLLIKLFKQHSLTVKEILKNIPQIGYYKDYFFILQYSRNPVLNEYIYDLIKTQLQIDINNHKSEEKTGTLIKWLPRENSQMDKKLKFVDKMAIFLFPDVKGDKFTLRKRYRKLLSSINSKLNVLEIKLCKKDYQSIDFNNMTRHNMKKYKDNFLTNPLTKDKFTIALKKYYQDYNLELLIKFIINKKYHTEEKQVINDIWNNKKKLLFSEISKYINSCIQTPELYEQSLICLDLSKDIFGTNGFFSSIIITLLNLENNNDSILINSKNIKTIKIDTNKTVIEKIDLIIENISSYKNLDFTNIKSEKPLLVLTDKVTDKCRNFMITNDFTISDYTSCKKEIRNERVKIITKILNESTELSDKRIKKMTQTLLFVVILGLFIKLFINNFLL